MITDGMLPFGFGLFMVGLVHVPYVRQGHDPRLDHFALMIVTAVIAFAIAQQARTEQNQMAYTVFMLTSSAYGALVVLVSVRYCKARIDQHHQATAGNLAEDW